MKAVTRPGTGKPGLLRALQLRHLLLRRQGAEVEDGMLVVKLAEHLRRIDMPRRVERHQHRLPKRQRLQPVDPVVQANPGRFLRVIGRALVVPRRPGGTAPGHHAGVGVQHGVVGLVADGTQHPLLSGAGLREQAQGLVAVHGQDHGVKVLHTAARTDEHAGGVALDTRDGRGQACIQPLHDGMDIPARAARHGVPPRPVAHLDEAVVVAEAHHGGHRKAQHLVGRAAPDATQHGQKIPMAKRRAKAMLIQELPQRLRQRLFLAALGQRGAQAVEAQQLGEHAQETWAQQVAPLGKHRGQVGAAPLQRPSAQRARTRHLNRKRHIRRGRGHLQLIEQRHQAGVGAFVEHQKAGVHALRDGLAALIGQGHIHGMGVTAEIPPRFEQRDAYPTAQPVRGSQTRDARSDDCDFHALFPSVVFRVPFGPSRCGVMY